MQVKQTANRITRTITCMALLLSLLMTAGSQSIEAVGAIQQEAEQQAAFIESLDLPEQISVEEVEEKGIVRKLPEYDDNAYAEGYELEDGQRLAFFLQQSDQV